MTLQMNLGNTSKEHSSSKPEDKVKIICKDGNKYWYLNDKLHREDGPAVEYKNGYKSWYIHGKRHREDGPAIEFAEGDKSWYINDKCHREDGPAYEDIHENKKWILNNITYGVNNDFTNESWKYFQRTLIF